MMKRCAECSENFQWDDEVIKADDQFYHEKCVELYPTGYVAFVDDVCIGETENDGGDPAYDIFSEGEYEEETDND